MGVLPVVIWAQLGLHEGMELNVLRSLLALPAMADPGAIS